jgi:hypothetical protein
MSTACIHSFPHVWCNPVKSFCSDVWNAQFNILFQFFWCVRVVFVHVLLQDPPNTEIQWPLVRGSRGPQVSRNNGTTKELIQHQHFLIFCMRRSPILLKQAVTFVNFQKSNKIHSKFLVPFSCYHFTEENVTNCLSSRDSTAYSDFWGV